MPVFSRLTLAWLSAGMIVSVFAGSSIYSTLSGRAGEKISLPVETLEVVARAQTSQSQREINKKSATYGVRLGAPSLREGDAYSPTQPARVDGVASENPTIPYPDDFDLESVTPNQEGDNQSGEIIITIPGENQRANGATLASITTTNYRPIADPDPALLRSVKFGKAPKVSPDGRKAMDYYASDFTPRNNKPRVAIIVGGLGLNTALTERAIDELPPEVTLAFTPYAKDLAFWTEKARKAGHEIIIELPMEAYSGNVEALGAAALLPSRTSEENLQRLDWLMSRFEGYFAATNYLGSKFSADSDALEPILSRLSESGVAYFDDTGAAQNLARNGEYDVASISRIIPAATNGKGRDAVRRELRALENIAANNGVAIGKTYAYAATLDEIAAWAQKAEDNGVIAAPASAVLQTPSAKR